MAGVDGGAGTLIARSAEATGVDAFQIERELARLWDGVSRDAADRGVTTMRASVLNLVVYLAAPEHEAHVHETLASLATLHPARTLVVRPVPEDRTAPLDARIEMLTRIDVSGRYQACQERITIRAHGPALRRVPGIVIPLLMRQLPTVIWWVGDLSEEGLNLLRSADFADGVIVDSAEFRDGAHGVPTLQRLRSVLADHIDLADLNWTRTAHWRELIAQCFDSAETRPYLHRIRGVTIELGRDASGAVVSQGRALMLVAWLASRLGWTPLLPGPLGKLDMRTGTEWSLRFAAPDAAALISVTLRAYGDDYAGLSGLRAIILHADIGEGPATFTVERADDRVVGLTRCVLPGRPEQRRTTGMQFPSQAELLAEELAKPARDSSFEATLALVAIWLS